MLLSFVYLAFVSMLKLFVRRHPEHLKDIELMVLRHQLDVLRRNGERPRLRPADRALLAAASLWGAQTRSPFTQPHCTRE